MADTSKRKTKRQVNGSVDWDRWVTTDGGVHRRVVPRMPDMSWLHCPRCGEAPCACEVADGRAVNHTNGCAFVVTEVPDAG